MLTLTVVMIIYSIEGMISNRQNNLYKFMLRNTAVLVVVDFLHNLREKLVAVQNIIPSSVDIGITYVYFACVIVGLVMAVFYIGLLFQRKLSKDERFSLFSYIFISVYAIFNYIVISSSAIYVTLVVISLLFLVFTLQNPAKFTDSDSRTWNFNAFKDYTTGLIENKTPFVLINFKVEDLFAIENSFNRQDADALLHQITSFFRRLSDNSILFRINSDNFVLIISSDSDIDNGIECARRALFRFGDNWKVGDKEITLFIKACVVQHPKDFESLDDVSTMMRYMEDGFGDNEKYILTAEDIDIEKYFYEIKVDNILKRSLEEGLLEVYFQPIYDVKKGKFTSAEALLRLKDTEMGFISPGVFVPIAEKTGTIVILDDYVFSKVCHMLKNTKALEYGLDYVEINLSVIDSIQKNLSTMVNGIMKKYGIDPSHINFEVTETSSEEITERMNENIYKLHDMGFGFSLDDFGTGYSNIYRVHKLPIEIIKIDKTIIQHASRSDVVHDVMVNMIDLIKKLDLNSVAEGVENKEQVEELSSLGVGHLQGYYYSPALPTDEFVKFLHDHNL